MLLAMCLSLSSLAIVSFFAALQLINAPVMKMLSQAKLVITALALRILLKRHIPGIRWLILIHATCVVCSFTVRLQRGSGGKWHELHGVILALLSVIFSTAGGVHTDWSMKKKRHPFHVQMIQSKFISVIGAAVVLGINAATQSIDGTPVYRFLPFGGPAGGWDRRVAALAVFCSFRGIITVAVLKFYDALWKTLAASVAMGVNYLMRVYMPASEGQTLDFDLVAFLLVVSVAIDAFLYSQTGEEQKQEQKEDVGPPAAPLQDGEKSQEV
eukprot:GHVU01028177.1.p1 GENE.GHVU01028177.1~~GHVU01028177.1.p1  ORF type:complete len:270 (+),score=24.28 GHVU01028177.1:602-1411(+)